VSLIEIDAVGRCPTSKELGRTLSPCNAPVPGKTPDRAYGNWACPRICVPRGRSLDVPLPERSELVARIVADTRRLIRGAIPFRMTVRRLEPTEWPTALNLRVAALTESPGAFGSTVVRERGLPLATWQARLTGNAWFAAFDAEIAVGLACGVHTETPDERELTGVWVAPSHRGTGLGDALVTSVRDWAALQGAHRLTLEVVRINESAIDLYTRHGFEVVGQTETPGHGLRENDIVMSLDLRRLARPAVRIERGPAAGTT